MAEHPSKLSSTGNDKNVWSDLLRVAADVFEIREWRDMDPVACFMLATYTAVIAQPLIFGNFGARVLALMAPVK